MAPINDRDLYAAVTMEKLRIPYSTFRFPSVAPHRRNYHAVLHTNIDIRLYTIGAMKTVAAAIGFAARRAPCIWSHGKVFQQAANKPGQLLWTPIKRALFLPLRCSRRMFIAPTWGKPT
jgi:hypothetical protein